MMLAFAPGCPVREHPQRGRAAEVIRPLSYLSDTTLDKLMSMGLAIAGRRGGAYVDDDPGFPARWSGPLLPSAIVELVDEYRARNGH